MRKPVNYHIILKSLLLLFMATLCGLNMSAKREVKNIYLFDCTNSMMRYKLWKPAKIALDSTITAQKRVPGTEFVVIPFGNEPYNRITFDAETYQAKKSEIDKEFEKWIKQATCTHITDVLEAGFACADPNKDNNIYLLTDGQPNQGDTPEKVAEVIRRWCDNHRNTRLFYVALKEDVISNVVKEVIEVCPDSYIVQCEDGVIPQFNDIATNVLRINLAELDRIYALGYSVSGIHPLRALEDDPLFDVKIIDNMSENGNIRVKIDPAEGEDVNSIRMKLDGEDYSFMFLVESLDPKYVVVNPRVTVEVSNEIKSRLTLGDGSAELTGSNARWYDSFLWSDALPAGVSEFDLNPVFEMVADNGAYISFTLTPGEDMDDEFTVYYNGEELKKGEPFKVEYGREARLAVEFDDDAHGGKRLFKLTPVKSRGIDIVNDNLVDNLDELTLRSKYNVEWNPLKILLMWIGIALLAFLVLWFAILKRMLYPTIKVGKIELAGPGSYYLTRKIKGNRKVVLTSRRQSQNLLSSLFTGKILYVKADHFIPDIEIKPVGGKKKIRLSSGLKSAGDGWTFFPSNTLSQYEEVTVQRGKEKFSVKTT